MPLDVLAAAQGREKASLDSRKGLNGFKEESNSSWLQWKKFYEQHGSKVSVKYPRLALPKKRDASCIPNIGYKRTTSSPLASLLSKRRALQSAALAAKLSRCSRCQLLCRLCSQLSQQRWKQNATHWKEACLLSLRGPCRSERGSQLRRQRRSQPCR